MPPGDTLLVVVSCPVDNTILAKDADHTPLELVNTELEETDNLAQGVSFISFK